MSNAAGRSSYSTSMRRTAFSGDELVDGGDGSDGIPDETHAVDLQRVLVFADRQYSVLHRQIPPVMIAFTPGRIRGPRRIDADNAGVRPPAAEQFAVQHARQVHVVGVDRLAARVAQPVDLGNGLADDAVVAHSAPTGVGSDVLSPDSAIGTRSVSLWSLRRPRRPAGRRRSRWRRESVSTPCSDTGCRPDIL